MPASGSTRKIKAGSTLKLTCRVFLGPQGPDQEFKDNAVVHWFHDQRLLDPDLDGGHRISTKSKVDKELKGWLQIDRVSPYDTGNYTCVPSYAIPDWAQIYVVHGMLSYD